MRLHARMATLTAALAAAWPTVVGASWQVLVSDPGKRIEIDRATIVAGENGLPTINSRSASGAPSSATSSARSSPSLPFWGCA